MAHGAEQCGEGVVVGAKGVRSAKGTEHGDGRRGVGRAGVSGDQSVVEDGVAALRRDGVEEGGGGGEAARDGVRGDEGGGGDGAGSGAEEERGGGEVGGEGVEVDEAESEVRVRRRVEERGGGEPCVEAAEGAEERWGGGGKGVVLGEAPQEDGALVGQGGGCEGRRRHAVFARLGARRAPPGSILNAGPQGQKNCLHVAKPKGRRCLTGMAAISFATI